MSLQITITDAQEPIPGLTMVTYKASTGSMWRTFDSDVIGGPGRPSSFIIGHAIVGTIGVALWPEPRRPPGVSMEELRAAIFAAEQERRKAETQ